MPVNALLPSGYGKRASVAVADDCSGARTRSDAVKLINEQAHTRTRLSADEANFAPMHGTGNTTCPCGQ